MNSGLTSHQQLGPTEWDLGLKSHPKDRRRGIDLAIPGLVVQRVIHYTTTSPRSSANRKLIISRILSSLSSVISTG